MSGSVSQLLDFLLAHAEIVGDLVQDREANLIAQLGTIREILQEGLGKDSDFIGEQGRIENGTFGERSPLVEAVQRLAARVEAQGFELAFLRLVFDHDLEVMKPAAKLRGQPIQHSGGLLLNFLGVQW